MSPIQLHDPVIIGDDPNSVANTANTPYQRLLRALGAQLSWRFKTGLASEFNVPDATKKGSANMVCCSPMDWCPPGYDLWIRGAGADATVNPVQTAGPFDQDAEVGLQIKENGSAEGLISFSNHAIHTNKLSMFSCRASFAMSFWVKVPDGAVVANQNSMLFTTITRVSAGSGYAGLEMVLRDGSATDKWDIWARRIDETRSNVDQASSTYEFNADEWVLVVLQFDGSTLEVITKDSQAGTSWWDNRASVASTFEMPFLGGSDADFIDQVRPYTIGGRSAVPDSACTDCEFSGIAIFARTLTQDEIQAMYDTANDADHDWSTVASTAAQGIIDPDISFEAGATGSDICFKSAHNRSLQFPLHGPGNREASSHAELISRPLVKQRTVHGFGLGDSTFTINGNGTYLCSFLNYFMGKALGLPPVQMMEKGGQGFAIYQAGGQNDLGAFEGWDGSSAGDGTDFLGNQNISSETWGYETDASMDDAGTYTIQRPPFNLHVSNSIPFAVGSHMITAPTLWRAHFPMLNDTRAGQGKYQLHIWDTKGWTFEEFSIDDQTVVANMPTMAIDDSDPTLVANRRAYHEWFDFEAPSSIGWGMSVAAQVNGEIFPMVGMYYEPLHTAQLGVLHSFANSGRTAEAEAAHLTDEDRPDDGLSFPKQLKLTDMDGTLHGPNFCILKLAINDIYSLDNTLDEIEEDTRTIIAQLFARLPDLERVYLTQHPWREPQDSTSSGAKHLRHEALAGVHWKIANDTPGVSYLPVYARAQQSSMLNADFNCRLPIGATTDTSLFSFGRSAITTGQNQIVRLSTAGSSGTFTLTVDGETTSSLTFDDTAADIQTALNALASLTGAVVTGGPLGVGVGHVLIEFTDGSQHAVSLTSSVSGGFPYLTELMPATLDTRDIGGGSDHLPSNVVPGIKYHLGEVVRNHIQDALSVEPQDEAEMWVYTQTYNNDKFPDDQSLLVTRPFKPGVKHTDDKVHLGFTGQVVEAELITSCMISPVSSSGGQSGGFGMPGIAVGSIT